MSRPRVSFDRGKIVLHSDGPWQEMTAYETAGLIRDAARAIEAAEMWRLHPPATDPATWDVPEG
jgi:hypothetical protein